MTISPTGEVRRISDELLARIVAGTYPTGLKLPSESALAAEFSCGRSTVREALRHLTDLGVLRSRRGSGALVLDFRREGTPALMPSYVLAGRFDSPTGVLARELLHMRAMLATEAVRLAARYAPPGSLAEARRILASAPSSDGDPVAQAVSELDLFRALVTASGIWPAVWLGNVFHTPMRELHAKIAPFVRRAPADFKPEMERMLDRVEARDEVEAVRHLAAWLHRVDADLVQEIANFFERPGDAPEEDDKA